MILIISLPCRYLVTYVDSVFLSCSITDSTVHLLEYSFTSTINRGRKRETTGFCCKLPHLQMRSLLEVPLTREFHLFSLSPAPAQEVAAASVFSCFFQSKQAEAPLPPRAHLAHGAGHAGAREAMALGARPSQTWSAAIRPPRSPKTAPRSRMAPDRARSRPLFDHELEVRLALPHPPPPP
jgi:hypothetical protein